VEGGLGAMVEVGAGAACAQTNKCQHQKFLDIGTGAGALLLFAGTVPWGEGQVGQSLCL